MFNFGRSKEPGEPREGEPPVVEPVANDLDTSLERKPFMQAALPVFACGAGLFSDGYINNVSVPPVPAGGGGGETHMPQVIGSVNTVLKLQYQDVYTTSQAAKYVADIAFAGTVVGQLVFGFTSDHWSRSNSLLLSTVILIIFTALAAGSYYRGDAVGMFNMLAAWRFFVGIGIGGASPLASASSKNGG